MTEQPKKSAIEQIMGVPIKGEFMLVGLNRRVQHIPQTPDECPMQDLELYGFKRGPDTDIRPAI